MVENEGKMAYQEYWQLIFKEIHNRNLKGEILYVNFQHNHIESLAISSAKLNTFIIFVIKGF